MPVEYHISRRKPQAPCRKLRSEVRGFVEAAARQAEAEARAERNRQLREEESKFEKPNPLELYLEMLAATDEATVAKEGFTAMGSSSDVPKLFKCNGKVGPIWYP